MLGIGRGAYLGEIVDFTSGKGLWRLFWMGSWSEGCIFEKSLGGADKGLFLA